MLPARRIALVALSALLLTPVVHAQPVERDRALDVGRDALTMFEAERWSDAYETFRRADALVHSPVFVLYMARSQRKLGRLLAARALYEQVEREALPADAPEPWHAAQREAAAELGELKATIPSLRVLLDADVVGHVSVLVDGVRLDPPPIEAPIEVNPGLHDIVIRNAVGAEVRQSARALEGAGVVEVDFRGATPGMAPVPQTTRSAPVPEEPDDPNGPTRVAGITLLVIGGVGLCAWLGTGAAAMSLDGELEDDCPDGVCGVRNRSDVDNYYALANAATGTLIGGSVLSLVGIILLGVAASGPAESEAAPPPVAWSASFGPDFVGVVGRF